MLPATTAPAPAVITQASAKPTTSVNRDRSCGGAGRTDGAALDDPWESVPCDSYGRGAAIVGATDGWRMRLAIPNSRVAIGAVSRTKACSVGTDSTPGQSPRVGRRKASSIASDIWPSAERSCLRCITAVISLSDERRAENAGESPPAPDAGRSPRLSANLATRCVMIPYRLPTTWSHTLSRASAKKLNPRTLFRLGRRPRPFAKRLPPGKPGSPFVWLRQAFHMLRFGRRGGAHAFADGRAEATDRASSASSIGQRAPPPAELRPPLDDTSLAFAVA
jgi:hypothetical protein